MRRTMTMLNQMCESLIFFALLSPQENVTENYLYVYMIGNQTHYIILKRNSLVHENSDVYTYSYIYFNRYMPHTKGIFISPST